LTEQASVRDEIRGTAFHLAHHNGVDASKSFEGQTWPAPRRTVPAHSVLWQDACVKIFGAAAYGRSTGSAMAWGFYVVADTGPPFVG